MKYQKCGADIPAADIMTRFSRTPPDFQDQFSVLGHRELACGQKEGDLVFIVPFR
jgi:hypothetical protein